MCWLRSSSGDGDRHASHRSVPSNCQTKLQSKYEHAADPLLDAATVQDHAGDFAAEAVIDGWPPGDEPDVLETEPLAGFLEHTGSVARAIVGHDARDRHAQARTGPWPL